MKKWVLLAWVLAGCAASQQNNPSSLGNQPPQTELEAGSAQEEDPFLWLEDIEGTTSLNYVEERNKEALGRFEADGRYRGLYKQIEAIHTSVDRIPYVSKGGDGLLYNFWQDSQHVRGLWRRTSLEEYAKEAPDWELLLDLDEVAKAENENWVWKGAECLPDRTRCLLYLSKGGGDATVVREYDLPAKQFLAEGFTLPEAKSRVSWKDANTLYVGTDMGPGSMTSSGYPRTVRVWTRGTPLNESIQIFEGKTEDVSVGAYVERRKEGEHHLLQRNLDFYNSEYFRVLDDNSLVRWEVPTDWNLMTVFQGQVVFSNQLEWKHKRTRIVPGTVFSVPLEDLEQPGWENKIKKLFAPTKNVAFNSMGETQSALYLTLNQDVKARVKKAVYRGGRWALTSVKVPDFGGASLHAGSGFHEGIFMSFESFLVPSSVMSLDAKGKLKTLKSLPARFDARLFKTEQRFVKSKDGVKIPYFVIRPKTQLGPLPTLLYGYGGFEISLDPFYLGSAGKAWLEAGRVYVVANIRGGGEYGPGWHRAALRENRQKAFDDFIAVAQDLIKRKITEPMRLGIQGGSNGGLLVGATFVQRPDLFNAVVCSVPLLDMFRYHKLLAGASWMAEYGNPDVPEDRAFIERYSPYQNVKAGVKYPEVLFMTSTKDDRVHPGHARKMVAKMKAQGHPVIYYENTEGGHAGAANLIQRTKMDTIKYLYLIQKLVDEPSRLRPKPAPRRLRKKR